MAKISLLFPGQGSQYVGMAQSYWAKEEKEIIDEANSALGFSLSDIMFEGDPKDLADTKIAQPAILLHSFLVYSRLKKEFDPRICGAIGHSLGEYSALVAASVIKFSDALLAVHKRGKFMQDAVPKGEGAMAAIIGLAPEKINQALADYQDHNSDRYAQVANYNGDMQSVIAGRKLGVEKACEDLKSLGARRIVPLQVSAPFHCALMKPVQDHMTKVLDEISFNDAAFPIFSNVTAQKEISGEKIKGLLIEQIIKPVRFTECIRNMQNEDLLGDLSIELGPKNVLSGLLKKIEKNQNSLSIDEINDFEKLKEQDVL